MRGAAAPSRTSTGSPARRRRALFGASTVSFLALACLTIATAAAPAGAAAHGRAAVPGRIHLRRRGRGVHLGTGSVMQRLWPAAVRGNAA